MVAVLVNTAPYLLITSLDNLADSSLLVSYLLDNPEDSSLLVSILPG